MFLEPSNFPAFSLPESYSPEDKLPTNSLHSRISMICECVHIPICFPSRRPIFYSEFLYFFKITVFRLSFSGIERTISLSRLGKVLKWNSLCNLQPRTKELCWRVLDSRLLAKTAYYPALKLCKYACCHC